MGNILDPYDPYLRSPPKKLPLEGAVGTGLMNDAHTIGRVQHALNHVHQNWGGPAKPLQVDGEWDKRMVKAIQNFKKYYSGNEEYLNDYLLPGDDTVKKIEQILGGHVDIVVMQKGGGENMANIRRYWSGEVEAVSNFDMVSKVKKKLSEDPSPKKLKYLFIIGHAAPGSQTVGSGKKQFGYNTITLANLVNETFSEADRCKLAGNGQTENDLAPLVACFAPNAIVTLGGCRVSLKFDYTAETLRRSFNNPGSPRTIDGTDLLKAVSKALGNVWVQGGDQTQQVIDTFGIDGVCWRCNSGGCFQIAADSGYLAPG